MNDRRGLLDAILADPDDDGLRLIYADWLDDHGDAPRAEFVRTQIALAHLDEWDDRHEPLLWRQRELLLAHEAEWVGDLAGWLEGWTFRRGFIDEVRSHGDALLAGAEELLAREPVTTVASELGPLAASPWLRRVRAIVPRGFETQSDYRQLVQSPHLNELRSLHVFLNTPRHEHGSGEETWSPLLNWPGLERLERLILSAGCTGWLSERLAGSSLLRAATDLDFDELYGAECLLSAIVNVHLPRLRRLVVTCSRLSDEDVRRLTTSRMPALETLDLSANEFGGPALVALADWSSLASVRRLDLSKNAATTTSLSALAASRHLPKLRWLDVASDGAEPPDWADLVRAEWLPNLRHLGVSVGHTDIQEFVDSPHVAGLRSLKLAEIQNLGLAQLARAKHLRPRRLELRTSGFADAGRLVRSLALSETTTFRLCHPTVPCAQLLGHFTVARPLCQPLDVALEHVRPTPDDLAALLNAPWLSRVRRLQLDDNELDDEAAIVLSRSPNLARVEVLGLRDNRITSRGVEALLASPHLSRLRALNLGWNRRDDETCAVLAASPKLRQLSCLSVRCQSDAEAALLMASPHLGPAAYVSVGPNDTPIGSPYRGQHWFTWGDLGYPSEHDHNRRP